MILPPLWPLSILGINNKGLIPGLFSASKSPSVLEPNLKINNLIYLQINVNEIYLE